MSVRWGDMDAVGHVNNATYLTYFEQARIDWYQSLGLNEAIDGRAEGPVVVSVCCNYLQAIRYPETITIDVFGTRIGSSSFDTVYELRSQTSEDILYARGLAVSAWINHNLGQSIALPDEIRAALTAVADS